MPKATISSKHDQHNVEIDDNNPNEDVTSEEESPSSDQEVFFNTQPSTGTSTHEMPSVYMPYIEGPTMDCMVNDGLYNRFFKW